jgi:hypothetical protein
MSRPEIILVAGLGRCGTSLMMQMLAAGGVPCVGLWPSFEDQDHNSLRRSDPASWQAQAAGRAVKLLDPHRAPPPAGPDYRVLWLFRDWSEQARSQLKVVGVDQGRGNRKRMERQLRRETEAAGSALDAVDAWRGRRMVVPFDCLLLRPREMAGLIAVHLGRDLDADAMVSCVVARAPACLPYLLEPTLVAMRQGGMA